MVKPNDIIISCSGTIGKISIITNHDKPGVINQALLILRFNQLIVSIKYIKYYLETFINLIVTSSGGAITNIAKRQVIEKIQIPIPPIAVQEEIVIILDLLNDNTNTLLKELKELRIKQYNYYLNELTNFQ